MNDLDMTDIPIEQRLAMHAERHCALWRERGELEHAADALEQSEAALEVAKTELLAHEKKQQIWEYKL